MPLGVAGRSRPRRSATDVGCGRWYRVCSRVGSFATSHAQAGPSRVCRRSNHRARSPSRRAADVTSHDREDGAWSYRRNAGQRRSPGVRCHAAQRCDAACVRCVFRCGDGVQQWRTSIGAADTTAGGAADEITHNLLTLVENRIYFNTNLGLVAALDADSGEICWISRYDRLTGKTFTRGASCAAPFRPRSVALHVS